MAKRVVILGAGYGGVRCALTLDRDSKKGETDILLVNKNNYHRFVTQLQDSDGGADNEGDIRVPLSDIFDNSRVRVIEDEVIRLFPQDKSVVLNNGSLNYDYLVVGLGSEPDVFEIPGLDQHSLTLRSLNSPKIIKAHIEDNLTAFKDQPVKRELLTIVVGGAGFTGVELAGKLADWVPVLAEKYDIPETLITIILIEASTTLLTGFDRQLIENAYRVLQEKGVRIITDVSVEGVTEDEVRLSNGESIRTRTFIWTGGIRAKKVVAQAGFAAAVRGRAKVNKYLQAVDFSDVYIIGDDAFIVNPDTGEVMAPTVQVAIQGGYIAARNILADIRGETPKVFHPNELDKVISAGQHGTVGKMDRSFKAKRKAAGRFKNGNQWRYLYSLGGFRLVAKKFLK